MKLHEISTPILSEMGVHDPHIFKAVFMAGPPGAGKSTVRKKLFSHTGLRVVDPDHIGALLSKKVQEQTNFTYNPHKDYATKLRASFVTGGLGLVIDGTNPNPSRTLETKKNLENLGYDTIMILVTAPWDVILQRMEDRYHATGRKVDVDYARGIYDRIARNTPQYIDIFKNDLYQIDNSSKQGLDFKRTESKINQWINKKPSKPAALDWINGKTQQRYLQHQT